MGYSLGAYSKGGLFLWQLESIIGREAMDKGWLVYYDKWKFKHPGPKDFIEVMEEVSGIELNWYLEQWVEDVQKINYVITSVGEEDGKTIALIHKKGQAAMPLDIELKLTNGEVFKYHIPLSSMQQSKTMDSAFGYFRTLSPWKENKDHYKMILPGHISEFQQLTIDPTGRLVDVVLEDNIWVRQ
jgi:aminopeptidase N